MPKFNVRFAAVPGQAAEGKQSVEAATPEEAVAVVRAANPGMQLSFVSEAKRGRPPKKSLVGPDPA